jgi:hypothetical protein
MPPASWPRLDKISNQSSRSGVLVQYQYNQSSQRSRSSFLHRGYSAAVSCVGHDGSAGADPSSVGNNVPIPTEEPRRDPITPTRIGGVRFSAHGGIRKKSAIRMPDPGFGVFAHLTPHEALSRTGGVPVSSCGCCTASSATQRREADAMGSPPVCGPSCPPRQE